MRPRLAVAAGVVGVAAMRLAARARVPDDYDSIGFVRALERYDLAQLQPHFPGYPVYVALGRAVAALGIAPLAAATIVSALASAATAAALFRLAARHDARAGWIALALWAAAWLPWLSGGAALSDATATAFVTLAFAALTYDGASAAVAAGACAALALGTRASYWPLAASFAVVAWQDGAGSAGRRRLVAAGALAGTIAWLAPFVAVVGPRQLLALGRTHVVGHFSTWGGSIATRPGALLRLGCFARDLAYDGMFAHVAALVAALMLVAVIAARARPSLPWRRVAVVALPYAVWVLLAQNVIEQPRHVLPLVAGACVLLAYVLARGPRPVAAVVVLLALAPSLPLAVTRTRTPPAAAQAAAWAAARFPQRNQAAIFGARSLRFFALYAPSLIARPRTWLSEVDVELERLDVLPENLLITSEVEIDPRRAPRVSDGPTFCRDVRIDRAQPCLTVRFYRLR